MNNNKYNQIYTQLKENSIGQNKKSEDKRYKKKYHLTQKISLLMCILAASAVFTACSNSLNINFKNVYNDSESQTEMTEYKPIHFTEYDYDIYEISIIEEQQLDALLNANGLTEYTRENGLRNYNYTAEDYLKMEGLDEKYIAFFYCVANEESLNEFIKAFGYDNLESYVRSKGFVDNEGNVDIKSWEMNCLNELGYELHQEAGETKTR